MFHSFLFKIRIPTIQFWPKTECGVSSFIKHIISSQYTLGIFWWHCLCRAFNVCVAPLLCSVLCLLFPYLRQTYKLISTCAHAFNSSSSYFQLNTITIVILPVESPQELIQLCNIILPILFCDNLQSTGQKVRAFWLERSARSISHKGCTALGDET